MALKIIIKDQAIKFHLFDHYHLIYKLNNESFSSRAVE